MKIEVGPGNRPQPGYDYYVDLIASPHANVRAPMDALPFASDSAAELYAADVLEHQSYLLTVPTLAEWYRVLAPGGLLKISVPNAHQFLVAYARGDIDTLTLNFNLLGGTPDYPEYGGYDDLDKPRWWPHHHHALFDWHSLKAALGLVGFHITRFDIGDRLRVEAYK